MHQLILILYSKCIKNTFFINKSVKKVVVCLQKNGDIRAPDDHNGTHAPHWDVQHPDGTILLYIQRTKL